VQFKTPFADWQGLFANLLPAHVMEKVGWNPMCLSVDPSIDVSGGPFAISSVSAQKIVLTDNPHWWGVRANAKAIVIHMARSTSQLAQWIRTGYVQIALPSSVSPSFLTQMASLPGAQTAVAPSSTLLQLEMDSGPNTNLSPDMRFAVALSVDRQALVNNVAAWALPTTQVADSHIFIQGQSAYHGQYSTTPPTGEPTTSSSTSTTLIGAGGSVNFPPTSVLDQADALMTASGFERTNGSPWHTDFGAPFGLHFAVDEADPWAASTAPLIQAQLELAGFTVSIYKASSAQQAGTALADGLADLALVPRVDTPFTSQSLSWYTTALGPVGQNGSQDWSSYDSDTFNALLESASQQLNPDTAATAYAQADTMLWDDMVALPLFVEPATMVWSRILGGVTQIPKGNSLLWYAQFWAVRVPESTSNTTPTLPGQ
jgi:peptide/nickel transport system substrate-binding protein